MNHAKTLSASLLIIALAAASCHRPQEAPSEPLDEQTDEEGVFTMPDYHASGSATAGGQETSYEITRQACDSLPLVTDGARTARDNTIRLTLTRGGGVLFDRVLTKGDFRSYIDEDFFSRSILDGMRFSGAEAGRGLTFSVSVSEPGMDMTVPLLLTVSPDGGLSIARDEVLDVDL